MLMLIHLVFHDHCKFKMKKLIDEILDKSILRI